MRPSPVDTTIPQCSSASMNTSWWPLRDVNSRLLTAWVELSSSGPGPVLARSSPL